jgi:hypothetical protein
VVSAQVGVVETIPSWIEDQKHVRKLIPIIYVAAQSLNEGVIKMEITLQGNSLIKKQHIPDVSLTRGVGLGLIAGLAGTVAMDLVLMITLPIAGLPALTCFSIVGNTVARFFSIQGIEMAGGIPLGVLAHYLIGPAAGAIFGAAVTQVKVLRPDSLKKSIILAILYVQILSQPILATTPILLKMTVTKTLQWYGGSFVMHSVLGLVLGVIMSYGLWSASRANHRWFGAQLAGNSK